MALGKTESDRRLFGVLTHADEIPKLETENIAFRKESWKLYYRTTLWDNHTTITYILTKDFFFVLSLVNINGQKAAHYNTQSEVELIGKFKFVFAIRWKLSDLSFVKCRFITVENMLILLKLVNNS